MIKLDITPKLKRQLKRKYKITNLKDFIEWHIRFVDIIEEQYYKTYQHVSVTVCEELDPNSMTNSEET